MRALELAATLPGGAISQAPRRTPLEPPELPGPIHGSAPDVVSVAMTGQPMATKRTAGTTTKIARNRFF